MELCLRWLLVVALACASLGVRSQIVGKVEKIQGSAMALLPNGTQQTLFVGQDLPVGTHIETGPASEVHVMTEDGGYLALRPNTQLVLQKYLAKPDSTAGIELGLIRGALRSITGWIGKLNPSGYKISTATATLGIRGTDHEVSVLGQGEGDDPAGTYDSVREGVTILRNREGTSLELEAGQDGFVGEQADAAPRRLARRPGFLLRRILQIEDRVEERRGAMAARVEAFIRDHPERAQKLRERWDTLSPEQKDKARETIRNQVQRRRQQQ